MKYPIARIFGLEPCICEGKGCSYCRGTRWMYIRYDDPDRDYSEDELREKIKWNRTNGKRSL